MRKGRTRTPGKFGLGLTGGKAAMVLAAVALACCARLPALDPSLDISQYAHTSWKVRDGFAKGAIMSIAQTRDGYLWLGTEVGLVRFDGVRAVPWQPPPGEQLPSRYISSVLVARDGTLWIGTMKGLASWKDGRLRHYPEVAGQIVASLIQDHEGTVWFGAYAPGRLCAIQGGKVQCHGAGTLGVAAFSLCEDADGNLWVSANTGLWRWKAGRPERIRLPGDLPPDAVIEDTNGSLLMTTVKGLERLAGGKTESYALPGVTVHFRPRRFLRGSDGTLWIGADEGLLRLHQGKADLFGAGDGLSGDSVRSIFEDREGNLWVATTNGLDRFREYPIPTISRKQGVSSSNSWALQATPDGSVWLGTSNGLNRWANGRMTVYRDQRVLGQGRRSEDGDLNAGETAIEVANSGLAGTPQSLGLDDQGRLYVSTRNGVFRFEDGRFIRVPGIPGGNIWSIVEDGHGKTWMSDANRGLLSFGPGNAVQSIPFSQFGQKSFAATALLPDRSQGGVWLGFWEGGIAYFKDGQVRNSYTAADGLGGGRVIHLRFGSRGAVWAATEGGLSRIKDGHIETLSSKNGLPCDEVHWSMEDDDHAVWVYMPCGLARIDRSEWYAWADDPRHVVKSTLFDMSDGVGTVGVYGGYGPHVTKTPDGRIWFVPRDGVSVIDPHHLPFNKLPPPVHIEQITADGKSYDPVHASLPPHVRYVAIDYTALSLTVPEKVHFRFKLDGQDPNWREVVNVRQVEYSNLPPGDYHFRVTACNNSGVWNEIGDSLDFSIAPAYYQAAWFRLLCVATFLALLYGLYRVRLWQQGQQFNMRLEERVNERTRIARELHDTLLQSFQGLLLKLYAATTTVRPDEAREKLEGLLEQGEQAIAEGRDAVQGMRLSTVVKNDLASALRTVGKTLAAERNVQSPVDFSVAVEGETRDLHPILRHEVYRIASEAISNAFRHSGARRIEVEIYYGDRQLRVRVRDNGKGIDRKVLEGGGRKGHFGLPGMSERAKLAGGKLTVLSKPGSGTEVELTIPASRAYVRSSPVRDQGSGRG